jgi:hypothetical protein
MVNVNIVIWYCVQSPLLRIPDTLIFTHCEKPVKTMNVTPSYSFTLFSIFGREKQLLVLFLLKIIENPHANSVLRTVVAGITLSDMATLFIYGDYLSFERFFSMSLSYDVEQSGRTD